MALIAGGRVQYRCRVTLLKESSVNAKFTTWLHVKMRTRLFIPSVQSSLLRLLRGTNIYKPFHTMSTSVNPELFSYTPGRFLYNETSRLRERYIKFDPEALLYTKYIYKITEGGFNRVFLITIQDGFQAIVKTLYNIAGLRHYTTASEAATLQFLYSKDLPVPKIYRYTSSKDNPSSIEYIVMEKAPGISLATIQYTLSKKQ
ncbi:hypothetical protein BO71DRAFT_374436 [Aspergillus ellipticus CBS 707.79]|uniref:Aminoglycoside phosphotransferase domain-containing protein n=1 Tax=Aspergillus ellipticus CBS 707.79 TaxID=1448320 RepID=A0A319DHG9_9EURO|nr:hypothetical protein BO71DRAFT_374436 [Aspergillus ellipticus CBS 707.79]